MEKIKLFIDTDMGGDVDDALALTAALRCENIRLMGVSTVYLRPEWRAQVACNVIEQCGGAPGRVTAMALATVASFKVSFGLRSSRMPRRKKPMKVSPAAVVSTAFTGQAFTRVRTPPAA